MILELEGTNLSPLEKIYKSDCADLPQYDCPL